MDYIIHLILGFGSAFVGLVPPSMMNMTATKITLDADKPSAFRFAVGASTVVFIQAFLALSFTKFLNTSPEFLAILKKVALFVFLAMAVYFFLQARKKFKTKVAKTKGRNFLFGVLLSAMNALAIPYYCGISTILEAEHWIKLMQPFILFFVAGAALGTLALLALYAHFAGFIQKRAGFIARNINYFLCGLTLILAVITFLKLNYG